MEMGKGGANLWARKNKKTGERTVVKDEEHLWARRKNRTDARKVGKNEEEEEVEDNKQNQKRNKIKILDRRTEHWIKNKQKKKVYNMTVLV
jgi:hypothetical protein